MLHPGERSGEARRGELTGAHGSRRGHAAGLQGCHSGALDLELIEVGSGSGKKGYRYQNTGGLGGGVEVPEGRTGGTVSVGTTGGIGIVVLTTVGVGVFVGGRGVGVAVFTVVGFAVAGVAVLTVVGFAVAGVAVRIVVGFVVGADVRIVVGFAVGAVVVIVVGSLPGDVVVTDVGSGVRPGSVVTGVTIGAIVSCPGRTDVGIDVTGAKEPPV